MRDDQAIDPLADHASKQFEDLVVETPDSFEVSGRVYVDPAIFERELDRVFGSTWVFVGHEGEVAKPGAFKTVNVGRRPVIVVRDDQGGLRALMNRCRHRGAALCRTEHGEVETFRCPYHGWTYGKDGRLLGVPNPGGYPDSFDPTTLSLRGARVESYRGLVFVNLAKDGPSLEEHLAPVRRYVDWWFDRSPVGSITVFPQPHRIDYPGNWKWQAENGHDGYHGDFTHESYHRTQKVYGAPSPRPKPPSDKVSRGFVGGHGMYERRVSEPWLSSWTGRLMREVPEYGRAMRERYTEAELDDLTARRDLFIFPNLYLFETHIRVIEPTALDATTVSMQFYELDDTPREVTMSRMQSHERFFGPAGLGTPDDVEMFVRNETGIRAFPDDTVVLSRGMHREFPGGEGETVGHPSDEVPLRALYREWKRLMA